MEMMEQRRGGPRRAKGRHGAHKERAGGGVPQGREEGSGVQVTRREGEQGRDGDKGPMLWEGDDATWPSGRGLRL